MKPQKKLLALEKARRAITVLEKLLSVMRDYEGYLELGPTAIIPDREEMEEGLLFELEEEANDLAYELNNMGIRIVTHIPKKADR
jgi:hypothetical protein